ncbi:penicillin-binding protein 2 [Alkalihalobacillus sp. MEB130]|uniref:peptidoglycan D,D-transpeptidase FtsI family protein n=1 Tax=Alkalihalobacillus sp. MEB130 TaxID=2976704 RepID=UPI0028DFA891|nr:penicillin-binding protein 2 [Alkalihalobacillus sp. MEB130]MDT8861623.1 penicillin-binding protein 2 [Alkalihalobacillus sp. MEB130]
MKNKNKQKKKKNHLTFRLNVLFFVVFIMFSALILRLGFVQIVEGETFVNELASSTNTTARIDAPRGLMYDRYGQVVVDNQLELSVTYTNPSRTTSAQTMLGIAENLEPMIEMESDRVTARDKRDYILLTMTEEERYELVTREERRELDGVSAEYQVELERITDEQIDSLTDQQLQVAAIFREMSRGYANSPQRIKQRISVEESHVISENLDMLPGIDILRDSTRTFPYGDAFRSFFGTTRQIPSERVDYYLSRGYDRSDIVGTSFIEQQYEEVLRGQKAVVESITKRQGSQMVESEVNERLGQRGNDLVLTLDMELQQRLEDIIDNEMRKSGNSFILDRSAYAVLMDPRTGDILAMAGFLDEAGKDEDSYADHTGTVNKAFEMGSSVKAASVLTGFHSGVASPGTRFNDRPIYLPNTPPKRSWNTSGFGWIDDRRALEQSSNVYMFEIGMRMANCYYRAPNASCGWSTGPGGSIERAYQEVRNNFSQFGLGSETGIDLPRYSSGLIGGSESGGNLLDLMIGQYDNYTTLQLAQYIATIANDGYRMEPRVVREIREPSTSEDEQGVVIQKFEPTILNRVEMSDAHISRVQQGLRDVMTRGTARGLFANASYQPAGKTGTAQVKVAVGQGDNRRVVDGNTQSLVGYAPFNNPEIAFAVVVPDVKLGSNGGRQGIAQEISKSALEAYFELKDKRNGATPVDEPVLEEIHID